MTKLHDALKRAYDFKPGRTFAQALGAALVADGTGLLDTDWNVKLSVSGITGLVCLLQIWSEGGQLFAERKTILGKA